MDGHERSIYLGEVAIQCRYALGAVAQLNNALNSLNQCEAPLDWQQRGFVQGEVFRSIHSLLTHASNISRIFWPPKNSGKTSLIRIERGRDLRTYIGLLDDHPLKKRTLRDHLEHFDERLDHWRETSKRRNFAQDNIGRWGSIAGIEESNVMRWYDPNARRFIFRGESFDIQELVSAIDMLLPIAETGRDRSWQEGVRDLQENN